MTVMYLLKRMGILILVIWAAATLIFILPRLATSRNPISARIGQTAGAAGYLSQNVGEMVKAWEAKFGLNQPLWRQYLYHMKDIATLDFGYSLAFFPARVNALLLSALPWTMCLFGTATLISFLLGSLAGALLAWPKAPKFLQYFLPFFLTLSAVPYYLLGLVLLFVFAFTLRVLPLYGGHSIGMVPDFSLSFFMDALRYMLLPGLAIFLSGVGFWSLQMRGTMVIDLEEDYINYAEAKGLKEDRIFFRYAIRNAVIPQATSLAISLGQMISGAILVEVVFGYPGLGTLLLKAVSSFDYNLISGIVFIIILIVAVATFIIDLLYPILDPRISYRRQVA
ncbi:MAG: ABC transporter permease [Spirochaetia bacterium]